MVYRRGKRPSFYFDAKTRTGFKQLCAHTPDKNLAAKFEHMWNTLADRHRAWDLLEPVLADLAKSETKRTYSIGRLWDNWQKTKQNVEAMRVLAADVDISPVVADWIAVYKQSVKEDTADHALVHVRAFFPENETRMASTVTADWLTTTLTAYGNKRNTRRKVHSSVTGFLEYCTRIKRLFVANPMAQVERPKQEESPIRFYESEDVERIVAWQPTEQRRALFAILYGAAVEISVAIALTREDFNLATHEVRAAGTKTTSRDRVTMIADWAWPIVRDYIRNMLPAAHLFEGVSRSGANFWHRQAINEGIYRAGGRNDRRSGLALLVKAPLKLPHRYPMHNARDHWAVRLARAGAPIQVIQHGLGHSSPTLTLKKYGRFLPSAGDRTKWEKAATQHDIERREAL